jgi:hypothetical protein
MNNDDAPNIPSSKQNLPKKRYEIGTRIVTQGHSFVRKKSHKKINFEFTDLTPAKNIGLSDKDAISMIGGVIQDHFGNQCNRDDINNMTLKRLDLARHCYVSGYDFMFLFELFLMLSSTRQSWGKTAYVGKDTPSLVLRLHSKQIGAKIKELRRIMLYFPEYKSNKNKLYDGRNLIKIEILRTKVIQENMSSPTLSMKFGELMTVAENNEFESLFYEWLYKEYSYLREADTININDVQEKLGVHSRNDAVMKILNGEIVTSEEKRLMFHLLLNMIDGKYRQPIMEIFRIRYEQKSPGQYIIRLPKWDNQPRMKMDTNKLNPDTSNSFREQPNAAKTISGDNLQTRKGSGTDKKNEKNRRASPSHTRL